MKRFFLGLVCVLGLAPALLADHLNPNEGVGRLVYETRALRNDVYYSTLNYQVKYAVDRFAQAVEHLGYCVQAADGVVDDHNSCPSHCRAQLDEVRRAFYDVDRYLRDTYYDYPEIYRKYDCVNRTLRQISIGVGPGNQRYRCVAVSIGWEEHGGHAVIDRILQRAQQVALYECQRYHGSCRIQRCTVVF